MTAPVCTGAGGADAGKVEGMPSKWWRKKSLPRLVQLRMRVRWVPPGPDTCALVSTGGPKAQAFKVEYEVEQPNPECPQGCPSAKLKGRVTSSEL